VGGGCYKDGNEDRHRAKAKGSYPLLLGYGMASLTMMTPLRGWLLASLIMMPTEHRAGLKRRARESPSRGCKR